MKNLRLKNILKEQDDNIDMIVGIIDMLLQIEDLENRKSIALDQIKKFKEEGIHFDYNSFLDAVGVSNMGEIRENVFREVDEKDAKLFISSVLKLGSRDNIFDKFMKKNKIRSDELITLVNLVGKELSKL
jgi:hypothetical protein